MTGLYDGDFIGYRRQAEFEVLAALKVATVAVDTNVLLDLYRYRPQTASDLLSALERVGERLVVPHQVVVEFWRRHSQRQATPASSMKPLEDAVGKGIRSVSDAISSWAKSVGVSAEEADGLTLRVRETLDDVVNSAQAAVQDERNGHGIEDPYLVRLESLLKGRVTEKPSDDQYTEWLAEGRRRVANEEPPGYLDADKEDSDRPEGASGDYLVWIQAVSQAISCGRDLIIITRDEKSDWWWRQGPKFMGPRPELSLEFHQASQGKRLFLLRPSDFLNLAPVALEVEVDEASSSDAGRVATEEEERTYESWTQEGVQALVSLLRAQAPVQAEALLRAVPQSGGRIMREMIYELGDYADDRTLRNFTRPFKRLTEQLQENGVVSPSVRPIFVARYPDGVRTSYFTVPPEVPGLLESLRSGTSQEAQSDGGEPVD